VRFCSSSRRKLACLSHTAELDKEVLEGPKYSTLLEVEVRSSPIFDGYDLRVVSSNATLLPFVPCVGREEGGLTLDQ